MSEAYVHGYRPRETSGFRIRRGRMRMGVVADGLLGIPPETASGAPPKLRVKVSPRRVRTRRAATLRVRVSVAAAGGAIPVKGAVVRIGRMKARTDARGRARLRTRAGFSRAKRYAVRASRTGYTAGRAHIRALR